MCRTRHRRLILTGATLRHPRSRGATPSRFDQKRPPPRSNDPRARSVTRHLEKYHLFFLLPLARYTAASRKHTRSLSAMYNACIFYLRTSRSPPPFVSRAIRAIARFCSAFFSLGRSRYRRGAKQTGRRNDDADRFLSPRDDRPGGDVTHTCVAPVTRNDRVSLLSSSVRLAFFQRSSGRHLLSQSPVCHIRRVCAFLPFSPRATR